MDRCRRVARDPRQVAASGGTLVDTADTYSDGAAESILGAWMRERGTRDDMVVVSKVGNHPRYDGLSAPVVTASVEESLRRLGTDHIDLYFAHYQDDETPVEESAAAFDALVRAGKIRAIGLSNFDLDVAVAWVRAAADNGLTTPVALQPHYSLAHRQPYETGLATVAAASGLAVLPYRALGGGFLSGKYRSNADTEGRPRGANVKPLLTPDGLGLLDTVEAIARDHEAAAASVALAWLTRQPYVVAPLASATDAAQLDELVGSTQVELTSDEVERLTAASALLG
ncbi:aldo/keto reductase [Nocardioides zhouii]|uniref:Aldo/keto reductase n=1 Tax=Nocardioides zhouii TaxID=1168729 RepID=A0A4Q2T8R9_9ACTN|nr:aldo/keto reductase [Nocardioides zhouii]RYC13408.1 aldo/keto reductase [Nocardioides zhouii]